MHMLYLLQHRLRKACSVSALPMADERNDTAPFLHWLRSNGGDHPKCGLAAFSDTGRGVVALQGVGCGEVVVSVPDEAALLPDDCCIASVRTACLLLTVLPTSYSTLNAISKLTTVCRSLSRLAWATVLVPAWSQPPLCSPCLQRSTV